MAANIVKPTVEEWAVLLPLLEQMEEGAIVIPPATDTELRREGIRIAAGELIEYDFGGRADVFVDVMYDSTHYAADAIRDHLGVYDET